MQTRSRHRGHQKFTNEDDSAARPCCARHVIVLLLCLGVTWLKSPGQNNVLGSSVPFLLADLELGTLEFSRTFALGTFCAAFVQPFAGLLLDRCSLRVAIPFGCAVLACGQLLLSTATSPLALFCAFVIIRGTAIGALEAWTSAAIARWYVRFRGRAMALVKVMGGLPTGVMATLMQHLDKVIGWRRTATLSAASLLALAAVCAALLRDPPSSAATMVAPSAADAEPSAAAEATPSTPSVIELEASSSSDKAASSGSHLSSPPASAAGPSPSLACPSLASPSLSRTQLLPADLALSTNATAHPPPPAASAAASATAVPAALRCERPAQYFVKYYPLCLIYCSVCACTVIGGGVDLFTVEMARGSDDTATPPSYAAAPAHDGVPRLIVRGRHHGWSAARLIERGRHLLSAGTTSRPSYSCRSA